MSAEMVYGGASLFLVWRVVKTGTPASAYALKQADGTTAATTAAHATLILDGYVEQTQLAPDSNGAMKVTVDNYDIITGHIDNLNVLAKKASAAAGTAPAPVFMEQGVERGGGTSTERPLVHWQSYGAEDGAGTLRFMHWGIGTVDPSSGGYTFKNGQWVKEQIIINSVGAEFDLAIPSTLWDAGKLGSVGSLTVPTGQHFMRKWLVAA